MCIRDRISVEAQSVKNQLIAAVDADTDAFTAYMDARRLPQATPEAKAARAAAMQDGLKIAIDAVSYTHLDVYKRQVVGPKSGRQCGSASFAARPAYSPRRTAARFCRSGVDAAASYR